eukprot:882407_1
MFKDRDGMNEFSDIAKDENIQISKGKYYEFYQYITKIGAHRQQNDNSNSDVKPKIPKTDDNDKSDGRGNVEFRYEFDSDQPQYEPLVELYTDNKYKLPSP